MSAIPPAFTNDEVLYTSLRLQLPTTYQSQDEHLKQISKIALSILSRNQDHIHSLSPSRKDNFYTNFSLISMSKLHAPSYDHISYDHDTALSHSLLKSKIAAKIFFKEQVYELDENRVRYLIRVTDTKLYEASDSAMNFTLQDRIWLSSAKLLNLPYSELKNIPSTLFFNLLAKLEVKEVKIFRDNISISYSRELFDALSQLDPFDFTTFTEMFTVKFAEGLDFQVPKAVLLAHKWFQSCFSAGMSENETKFIDFSSSEKVSQHPDLYYVGFRQFVFTLTDVNEAASYSKPAEALTAFLNDIIPTSI